MPLSVSVVDAAPTRTDDGLTLVRAGAGLFTAKLVALEVPPPGAGFVTVICAVPAVATSVAGIATCSCVELTNVVGRALPFHCTVEDEMKLDPVTVI